MTAKTARDRHAEHERTGQPCNCGTRGSDMAQAVAERIVAEWYPSISPKLYRDKLTESIATALRAERAAVWGEVQRVIESLGHERAETTLHEVYRTAALRARGEAGG